MPPLLPLVLCVLYLTAVSSSTLIKPYTDRVITMDLDSKMTCVYEILRTNVTLYLDLMPKDVSESDLSLRLTSPSGQFSEWVEGKGDVSMEHNITESGDYEICMVVKHPIRVTLSIFAEDPGYLASYMLELRNLLHVANFTEAAMRSVNSLVEKLFKIGIAIRFSNMISSRDEKMQQWNSFYIKTYVLVFCATAVIVAIVQIQLELSPSASSKSASIGSVWLILGVIRTISSAKRR